MNINKVRRVLKAQLGLPSLLPNSMQWDSNSLLFVFTNPYLDKLMSSLIGNPFMKSNGIPTVGKFNTSIDDKSVGKSLILPPTVTSGKPVTLLDVSSPTPITENYNALDKNWLKAKNYVKQNPSIIGLGIDFVDQTLFLNDYDGKYGALKQASDQIFDIGSSALMAANPLLGTAVKAGGLISDAMSKYLGVGTDNLTKTDAFFGSKLMSLTPLGLANNIFTKRTDNVRYDKEALERRGGAYTGSLNKINRAKEISNKEVGLFSSTKGFNRLIRKASNEAGIIANIDKEALDRESIATNTTDLNHIRYGNKINGGYDLRYIRAAKLGGLIKRIKKINFHKKGGEIKGVIDLNKEWTPKIIEPVKVFKEGGEITDEDRIQILEDIIKYGIEEGILDKDLFEPEIIDSVEEFKEGGKTVDFKDAPLYKEYEKGWPNYSKEKTSKTETLKNVIPDGALHAHKHNMENADGLTLKGIPVVDNNNELQAEIEREEWTMTLKLTKLMEELYNLYNSEETSKSKKDELAIEAGKILVHEILFNTDDRAGLIAKCENGGVIDGSK